MEVENLSSDQDGHANDVMESVGMNANEPETENEAPSSEGSHSNETLAVQKRLKSQKRQHDREVRGLHAKIDEMEARLNSNAAPQNSAMNAYGNQPASAGIDEQIHKAVSYALNHKDMEERKAREAQSQAHVQRQYQDFNKHLENVGDNHDDFHDVVFGHDTPYTSTMRDYAMTLPRSGAGSAGEVLYKLGKNPEELSRIAKLHPLDQASEMAKLSHSMVMGGEVKNPMGKAPLGNIKSNPVVNSRAVNDKTPISSLRERMKAGTWK